MTLTTQPDPILYTCPVCLHHYATPELAERCRDQPVVDGGWKVGDWVLIPQTARARYRHLGPGDWQAWEAFVEPARLDDPHPFLRIERVHFWWVVVGWRRDSRDPHRPCVILFTGHPDASHSYGWNPATGRGHYGLYRPGQPPTGDTAEGCTIHDPAWDAADDPYGPWLRAAIEAAVPPTLPPSQRALLDDALARARGQPDRAPLL